MTREFLSLPVAVSLHIENSSARAREKGKEDLELFLTRSKALGVIRSCLEWGQLSAVLVSPRVLSMGWIRKRVQKDWWVQCFPNEQPYTHNYTTEMNGSSRYKLRRGYANCSSNGKAAVSATQLQHFTVKKRRAGEGALLLRLMWSIFLLSMFIILHSRCNPSYLVLHSVPVRCTRTLQYFLQCWNMSAIKRCFCAIRDSSTNPFSQVVDGEESGNISVSVFHSSFLRGHFLKMDAKNWVDWWCLPMFWCFSLLPA